MRAWAIALVLAVAVPAWAGSGKTALKTASRELRLTELDDDVGPRLTRALAAVDEALADATVAAEAEVWRVRGEIGNAVSQAWLRRQEVGLAVDDLPPFERGALEGAPAFDEALKRTDRGYDALAARRGLEAAAGLLFHEGVRAYEGVPSDPSVALAHLVAAEAADQAAVAAGGRSSLSGNPDVAFTVAAVAMAAGRHDLARARFEGLAAADYDNPVVYSSLYALIAVEDPRAAYPHLDAGRRRYPDDVTLLFTEINHFLKLGEGEVLVDRLGAAIAKEPDNLALYLTLGLVRQEQVTAARAAGDAAAETVAFDAAVAALNRAIEGDPDYLDALVTLGTLYFNRAAERGAQALALADASSAEARARTQALSEGFDADMERARPFLERAEAVDPNRVEALLGLREIYARRGDEAAATALGERLARVQAGETLESSFFPR